MRIIFLLPVIISASVFATNYEPVTVFGLPLGGQLERMPKICRDSQIGRDDNKVPCWIGKPYVHPPTGGRYGHIMMPGKDKLPKWAAFAIYEANISKSGELEYLKLKTMSGDIAIEIERSISTRFGKPQKINLYGKHPSAEWSDPKISIKLLCDGETFCMVDFISAKQRESDARFAEELTKKDAQRAISP